MNTNNLVDVTRLLDTRYKDWYLIQDLEMYKVEYVKTFIATKKLLNFEVLSAKDLLLFDSTYKQILVNNKLTNVDDYITAQFKNEALNSYNTRDYDSEETFEEYYFDYSIWIDEQDTEYYTNRYTDTLNQMYKDYYWLNETIAKIDLAIKQINEALKAGHSTRHFQVTI
jgi:hypothetical protein